MCIRDRDYRAEKGASWLGKEADSAVDMEGTWQGEGCRNRNREKRVEEARAVEERGKKEEAEE